MNDPHWYKDAVIYEAHVRAFQDSNGDGIGDFQGLTSRLDYIQELGVNTIWLLPFFPSPGRDDGYDISDYHGIHPSYGTREDFKQFVDESHRRGLRVIIELVINHTSDQHPWFQAARHAPPGSPKRDFYVWSDDPNKYAGTRIIFTDTEPSNWTWDPVAKQYYWHRFFSHQPDLNFDNPHVESAVIKIMRYWLDTGVDGLRLDAIPYLIEREGTSNENLRETHDVIRRIRKVIDEHYADRMLLGEANMWPEDVRDYFGDSDECHMAYHFPLMPRMYMAIALEDRYPIVEIMEQTPDIPANCQWAIFLRNHDELTLEMVTSRERDYMWQMYATDARARLNLGIRRRLAPLMENDIERIKLMNSLLLSMPGSPIIYYGDEIGMGDNLYLGDRNGVRTPMQWSPDRNAGFSRADPQSLYLPPVMDAIYGYQAVNVEAQIRDRSSLLNWMKRLLQIRTSTHAFGRGTLRFIRPGNRKVLAYVREHGEDQILCVVNLARSAQPVELWLTEFKGLVPVEMLGRTAFPPIGDLPYFLTMPGYGFYWFRLSRSTAPPTWHEERLVPDDTPVLVLPAGWNSIFADQAAQWRGTQAAKARGQLEDRLLPSFVASQRWFVDREKPGPARICDYTEWESKGSNWLLALFDVEVQGGKQPYFVPLALVNEGVEESRWSRLQGATIARVRRQATLGVLADALADEQFCRAMVEAIGSGGEQPTRHGRIRFVPTPAYSRLRGVPEADLSINVMRQGSNTSVKVGQRLFLKTYRRLHPGPAVELEVGRFLTEVAQFPNVVPIGGEVGYDTADGRHYTLALLQGFAPNQGDGWDYTLDYLVRHIEDRRTGGPVPPEAHKGYLQLVRTLGRRTAELHHALASSRDDAAFRAEPVTESDLALWRRRALEEAALAFRELEAATNLPDATRSAVAAVLRRRERIERALTALPASMPGALKLRLHGDYQLWHVLLQRDDFVIIDFEGDPARTPDERREKGAPLRDVAGMLRSFGYARRVAQRRCALAAHEDCSKWEPLLIEWEREARAAFLASYDDLARAWRLYDSLDGQRVSLCAFEIEQVLHDLRRELVRPERVEIPLAALIDLAT